MKNHNLSDAIGNINLKYVEEARNYTAKRMSLTKIISLAACIAILVTAIPVALILNREDTETDAPVNTNEITTPIVVQPTNPDDTNKEPMKIVYCDESLKEVFKGSSLDIEIRDSSEIDLDLSSKVGEIEAGAEIPAKLYYTIGGKDLVCTFDTAYATKIANSASASLQNLANVARYKIENSEYDEAYLEYNCDSGKLLRLDLLDFDAYDANGDLTSEDAKCLAEKELTSLYGEYFNEFYYFESSKLDYNIRYDPTSPDGYSRDRYRYVVTYRRHVHGYPTESTLRVYYNMCGELADIYADNYGIFDGIESTITPQSIATAKEEALSLIDVENEPVEQMYLTMDVNGDVYWFVFYLRKPIDEPRPVMWEYIYKVN